MVSVLSRLLIEWLVSGGSRRRVGGVQTPYQTWGFFCFHHLKSIAKPYPGSTKIYFSGPEISKFVPPPPQKKTPIRRENPPSAPLSCLPRTWLRRVGGLRLLVIHVTTAIYFQNYPSTSHLSGKPWDPPYQKCLDPPLLGFNPWPGLLCCVLGQDTLHSTSISPQE